MAARKYVRIQEKGQVTLPADLRRTLNLNKGDLVAVESTDGGVLITPVSVRDAGTGSAWVKELYAAFAPARAEAETNGYREGEIDTAIDAARSGMSEWSAVFRSEESSTVTASLAATLREAMDLSIGGTYGAWDNVSVKCSASF